MTSALSADDRQSLLENALSILRPACEETFLEDIERCVAAVKMTNYDELVGSAKDTRKLFGELQKHLSLARDTMEALSKLEMALAVLYAAERTNKDRQKVDRFVTSVGNLIGSPELDGLLRGIPARYSDTLPMLLGILADRCEKAHELVPRARGGGPDAKDAKNRLIVYWARRLFDKHHTDKATVTGTAFRDYLSQFQALCGSDPNAALERAVRWVFKNMPCHPLPGKS